MSPKFPPPADDDASFVPGNRLRMLLGEFESELNKIKKVFSQHVPGHFQVPSHFEDRFWSLRDSAEDLGSDYAYLVEKIISDYQDFKKSPDSSKLEKIFSDVKSLQLLLVG